MSVEATALEDAVRSTVELEVHDTDMVLAVFADNPNGPRLFVQVADALRSSEGRPLDPGVIIAGHWPPKVYVLAGFVFTCSEEWRQMSTEPALEFRLAALWGEFDVPGFVRFCGSDAGDLIVRDADSPTTVRMGFSGPYEWLLAQVESFLGKERPT